MEFSESNTPLSQNLDPCNKNTRAEKNDFSVATPRISTSSIFNINVESLLITPSTGNFMLENIKLKLFFIDKIDM